MALVSGAAVVTGASRGIGAACAVALGRAGAGVVVNFHTAEEQAEAVVSRIRDEGGRAVAVQADVTNEEEVARLAGAAHDAFGPVGILVSNAAVRLEFKPFADTTWDDYQLHLDVTLRAFLLLAQAFLPEMQERGQGRLIGVGSTSVDAPVPGLHAYTASKAAQVGMLGALAKEVGPSGVTVNLVVPGYSATDRVALLSEGFTRGYAERNPRRRLGLPEDVAGAVCYLASGEADYVTGTSLLVEGGHALT
jgi:3-oxoacyl-[acyl-carrier protein] reductase